MFGPCPEGMANSGPNMAIVEIFFSNSIFFSNTKSQLALFTFSIAKKVMFRPCPEGMVYYHGTHEIFAIKSHQIQWDLMGIHEICSKQTSPNPMESHEIHEILAIKSHQIIKSNGISWDP